MKFVALFYLLSSREQIFFPKTFKKPKKLEIVLSEHNLPQTSRTSNFFIRKNLKNFRFMFQKFVTFLKVWKDNKTVFWISKVQEKAFS